MKRDIGIASIAALLAALVGACAEQTPPQARPEEKNAEASDAKDATKDAILNGAGATFPYPIYAKWADTYHKVTGLKLNYQSIGSGGGISQIKARTVDFGASDAPLTAEELAEAGLVQFPMVMGGVVPVVNIEGIAPGELKLDAAALAQIFLGEIKRWDDKKIRDLNPDARLPSADISVVHRADASGRHPCHETPYLAGTVPRTLRRPPLRLFLFL